MDEVKKKTRQFLTNDEKWAIYKFCIENHCISQNGSGVKFRVTQTIAADEINAARILNRKITSYHINNSVMEIVEWEQRFNKFPEPQETAELEQMRIQHIRDINEIEKLKLAIVGLQNEINKNKEYKAINNELIAKMDKAINILAQSI